MDFSQGFAKKPCKVKSTKDKKSIFSKPFNLEFYKILCCPKAAQDLNE